MTSPIEPGTPVTVVLTGTHGGYARGCDELPGMPELRFIVANGEKYALPGVVPVFPADGSDPVVLTPAIRSMAHRAARALPDTATPGEAVEAALSALEPVVAGLIEQAGRPSVTPEGAEGE